MLRGRLRSAERGKPGSFFIRLICIHNKVSAILSAKVRAVSAECRLSQFSGVLVFLYYYNGFFSIIKFIFKEYYVLKF